MRRAQVREAQKAYRSRQQNQLSTLKARVEQLEDAFDNLSQTVQAFEDQVIQSGSQWTQTELLQTVKSLREDIVSQFERAGIQSRDPPKDQTTEPSQPVNEQPHPPVTSEALIARDRTTGSNFWSLFLSSTAVMVPSTNTQTTVNESNDLIPVNSVQSTNETDTIPYATTPFTQRLYRACVESGYLFLSNNTSKDKDMWQFKYLLQRMPRAEIIEHFQRVANKEPCNPIIDVRFPYISIGGSGTHFLQHHSDAWSDNLAPFRTTNGVFHIPSDEEWFDIHDVERYLFNQGIGVGNFPASEFMESHSDTPNIGGLSLVTYGATPGSTMMVIDEDELVTSTYFPSFAFALGSNEH
ncbi:hypothetical protein N7457_004292 [Penicillium paradoxum]|uniref:uncharacterized protein n=1 Tax=Penicillium paradoxum TaxID=176176 RepID=UPI002549766A|nr:uncharacterized protein N7457_004292 [Penicillium paradoxum]KAJ5782518.1 hypothetical protein N7457_004292 [Penicillium paradoxum]